MARQTEYLPKLNQKGWWAKNKRHILWNGDLYLLILPTFLYFIIFAYVPMYGIQIAFRDYMPSLGFTQSPWVGLKHFRNFFAAYQFRQILVNTLTLSIYSFIVGFPLPVICSLLLNQIPNIRFKRFVQTITYAPNFISVIVAVGMLMAFLAPSYGIINKVILLFGGNSVNFMAKPQAFRHIYVWSGIWQGLGMSMIIYIAALSGVDPELHSAAMIDGASKFKRMLHIDIPGILPTISVILILSLGHIMSVGFEKVFLLQNTLNLPTSEVIATYVYKVGLLKMQYSYSTAIGIFNSVINCILLVIVNSVVRSMGDSSLW
jgi:putative aldouronate transport system permease protein